jgi:cell division septum initiation protein DivIVA
MRGRVKGLLGGGMAPEDGPPDYGYERPDPDAQRALQVLVMAQRTADEHTATAQQQADNIRADALATAEQIARDAQAHVEGARREAAHTMSDAQAKAEQIVREAQAHADATRRDGEKVLSDARAQAMAIGKDAQAAAAGLEREAKQRYDDVVGSLATKRDALQEQIEALQEFDRNYRSRLRQFMQGQLRVLGEDEPPARSDGQQPAFVATTSAPIQLE